MNNKRKTGVDFSPEILNTRFERFNKDPCNNFIINKAFEELKKARCIRGLSNLSCTCRDWNSAVLAYAMSEYKLLGQRFFEVRCPDDIKDYEDPNRIFQFFFMLHVNGGKYMRTFGTAVVLNLLLSTPKTWSICLSQIESLWYGSGPKMDAFISLFLANLSQKLIDQSKTLKSDPALCDAELLCISDETQTYLTNYLKELKVNMPFRLDRLHEVSRIEVAKLLKNIDKVILLDLFNVSILLNFLIQHKSLNVCSEVLGKVQSILTKSSEDKRLNFVIQHLLQKLSEKLIERRNLLLEENRAQRKVFDEENRIEKGFFNSDKIFDYCNAIFLFICVLVIGLIILALKDTKWEKAS